MSHKPHPENAPRIIERKDFDQLISALKSEGYELVGPTIRDQAIVFDVISSVADLPVGWTDEQNGGTYRLKRRKDEALFGYVVGPHSWKKFLFPPLQRLWQASRQDKKFKVVAESNAPPKFAFLGIRSCELHAIAVQDKVFLGGPFVDPSYQARRSGVFAVAINCGVAGGTCFCVSMKTGPKAEAGFDLALTEVIEADQHYFVAEAGSRKGKTVLEKIPHRPASDAETRAAAKIVATTAQHMGRSMETAGIKELLYANYEHPRWENVASRCLSCANCTMVCPTCFCTTVEDTTDLTGDHAERWRKWDSCFTMDFSYIHGGSVRQTTKSRYRQWMTHKLATWIDQFGTSGCVGCGRCITWCPVGIDITEEAKEIRGRSLDAKSGRSQKGTP